MLNYFPVICQIISQLYVKLFLVFKDVLHAVVSINFISNIVCLCVTQSAQKSRFLLKKTLMDLLRHHSSFKIDMFGLWITITLPKYSEAMLWFFKKVISKYDQLTRSRWGRFSIRICKKTHQVLLVEVSKIHQATMGVGRIIFSRRDNGTFFQGWPQRNFSMGGRTVVKFHFTNSKPREPPFFY